MERVVYILGAGFSAPLGLPLVGNFLEKSKDQYFKNPDKFSKFIEVFDMIRHMSYVKEFFNTDLSNIEEILSLLEMSEGLGEKAGEERSFKQYIMDVISEYTPVAPCLTNSADPFNAPKTETERNYIKFVAGLLGHKYSIEDSSRGGTALQYRSMNDFDDPFIYNTITLNYDMVLDNISESLIQRYPNADNFIRPDKTSDKLPACRVLAKLHGSIDTKVIVPPTWNKKLDKSLVATWKSALEILSAANHIRFLGYSLPVGDNYVKYLLRNAILDSKHLKTIHVVCLDQSGEVRKRFGEFICFKNTWFSNMNVENYLNAIRQKKYENYGSCRVWDLEHAHETFFWKM